MAIRHGLQDRDIHGILLFDKPPGLSSNDALQRVKRLF
ncbi:MAG: tRNA pseudouridine(55) synthase TruB, partial [Gammaproteobacteria bacterium]